MDRFMDNYRLTESYILKNGVYLMSNETEIIGFFSLIQKEDHSWELDLFFIAPEYMGRGYGMQLWHKCSSVARQLGVKEFTLWADPNTEDFYIKMGCEKIGVKKSPFMPNRYPPIMRFVL